MRLVLCVMTFGLVWGAPSLPIVAQRVTLRVRPPVGDTLWMKMDQTFEMAGDSSHGAKTAPSLAARVRVCTHTVVLGRTSNGTELESMTDSVVITPEAVMKMPLFANVRRVLGGRAVHLRVAENGALQILGSSSTAAASAVSMAMPPVLPSRPVAVGETWARDLHVPISEEQTTGGLVHATFHLDSLSTDQNIAYISMKGTLAPSPTSKSKRTTSRSAVGTLTGTMQIDRRLQWMVDSRATVTLNSLVRPSPGRAPVWMHMTVTQWLRAVPAP